MKVNTTKTGLTLKLTRAEADELNWCLVEAMDWTSRTPTRKFAAELFDLLHKGLTDGVRV